MLPEIQQGFPPIVASGLGQLLQGASSLMAHSSPIKNVGRVVGAPVGVDVGVLVGVDVGVYRQGRKKTIK